MKNHSLTATLAALALFCSCSAYDDSFLRQDLNDLKERIEKLEEDAIKTNSDLNSLSELIESIQGDGSLFIVDVTETNNGYRITFSDGSHIDIENGTDGKDAPTISVRQDTDGIYYWILVYSDGTYQWLTDDNGNKLRAENTCPVLGVDSEGYWTISYVGSTPERILDENGEPVPAIGNIFSDIQIVNDSLVITLSDGTSVTIPISTDFHLIITDAPDGTADFTFGQTRTFTIESIGVESTVIVKPDEWKASISNNILTVTAPTAEHAGCAELEGDISIIYFSSDRRSATVSMSVMISEEPKTVGVWVLCEGSSYEPTADLAYFDAATGTFTQKYYSNKNGEPLGQVANYMGIYGSKLYVAISGNPDAQSSYLKVLDARTGELLKSIPMRCDHSHGEGDVLRQLAFHNGKIYATSYYSGGKGDGITYLYHGGVMRIDTLTYEVEASVAVGDKPEGIAYHDGKLYVCISSSGNGNTISVVDVATFELEKQFTVPQNPTYIKTAPNGDIYFSTLEIYTGPNAGTPSGLHRLNPETGSVTTIEGFRASRLGITDRYIYSGEFSYSSFQDVINRYDMQTGDILPITLDNPFFMVYGFDVNPLTGDVYIGGSGEDVAFLNADGELISYYTTGVGFVNQFAPVFE